MEAMEGHTILVVEDEPSVARGLEYGLKAEGFTVLLTGSGRRAIEMVRGGAPHLVLLDIRLPDMSGVDVLARIRSLEETRQIPIVIVTASAMPHEKAQVQEAGVAGYLTKPIDVPLFLETVDAILAGRNMAGKEAAMVNDDRA